MDSYAGALPARLTVVPCVMPGRTCAESQVLMARARASGTFELLTVAAWARALGYPLGEVATGLIGRSLREIMELGGGGTGDIVAALLDEKQTPPIEVTLRSRGERRKRYRLHRRVDDYADAVFLVAEELPETSQNSGAAVDPGK